MAFLFKTWGNSWKRGGYDTWGNSWGAAQANTRIALKWLKTRRLPTVPFVRFTKR